MSKLYLVGTPIGNMKDITYRAVETLKDADVIACEDTRVTRKLLAHYEILDKKLISYNDRNEGPSSKGIVDMIMGGQVVAVVSDAGMPVVNDPGFEVIREAYKNDIPVEVIPGPSATLTTLVLSNFDTHFKFHGFLKPKTIQRQNQLKKFMPGTHIAFVSPHKLMRTLDDISIVYGEEIEVFLGRELTKKFETHYRGTITEVIEQVKDKVKGEFTIALFIPKRKVNKYAK
ncbi:MAG: 16S rRNA (cytidine(1402)-2'-O)-methyltransferase [Mycoplasmataceae bacterium]|nr:16S rRNA (cytidine(1402)-2'-O)-methyltransferase [Mycoplasmataceae bacterium]